MKKSMIEVAYQVLTNNNGAMPFVDLWKDVSQEMGFNQTQFEDNIAQFYTDLSLGLDHECIAVDLETANMVKTAKSTVNGKLHGYLVLNKAQGVYNYNHEIK